jgi:hypothetical protein
MRMDEFLPSCMDIIDAAGEYRGLPPIDWYSENTYGCDGDVLVLWLVLSYPVIEKYLSENSLPNPLISEMPDFQEYRKRVLEAAKLEHCL